MRKQVLLISLITVALSAGAAFAKGPGGGMGGGAMQSGASGQGSGQAWHPQGSSAESDAAYQRERKRLQDGSGAMNEYRTMEQNQVQPQVQTQMKSMGTPPEEALKQQEQIKLQDQLKEHSQQRLQIPNQ